MNQLRNFTLTAKNLEGCCMRIPTEGWFSLPHNGGVNGMEIDDFTAWLHTLDTQFEWEEGGMKYIDGETGLVRHAKCGDYLCQFRDENGKELLLNLDEYVFKCLFSARSD